LLILILHFDNFLDDLFNIFILNTKIAMIMIVYFFEWLPANIVFSLLSFAMKIERLSGEDDDIDEILSKKYIFEIVKVICMVEYE
jgi:hypothetical protein